MATAIYRETIPWSVALRKRVINWERLIQLLIVFAILGVWEYTGRRLGSFFLAPPSSLVTATGEMLRQNELVPALLDSISTLVLGYLLSISFGVSLGFAMGWFRSIGRVLDPFLSALYVMPIAALVPVIIIWFGLGFQSRLLTIFLFSVWEVTISTYTGVKNIDPMLVDVARSFNASRRQLLRKVALFAALPYIFAGLRMAASRAVKGMVIAELLFAVTGIGGEIQTAANYYRTDKVFVYVIVLSIIGVAFASLIQALERWTMPWKQDRPA